MSIAENSAEKKMLPVCRRDMDERGWNSCQFIIVTGDAYVDHPSFGAAVISRLLEAEGYRVGIIAQPDWKNPESFRILGRPDYCFFVTSGNIDSMVNHYSVSKKRRKTDSYSPGGKTGLRPDRAVIAYTSAVKQAWKGMPVILGGIEASLRRLSHYDYWSDSVRRSVLVDSKADMLVYGMGENPVAEIAAKIASGCEVKSITGVRGTVCRMGEKAFAGWSDGLKVDGERKAVILPSYAETSTDRRKFNESFRLQYENTNPYDAAVLVERTDAQYVVQFPPAMPLTTHQMDRSYGLPYTYRAHPSYDGQGGIPALNEVSFSITVNRGCFGSCSFCALTFHQGRIIQARSEASAVSEAEAMTRRDGFKGIIHDVGGPTADFFHPACAKQARAGGCRDRDCLFPGPCRALDSDHSAYLSLLRRLRRIEGVKKVFIRSGVRFDYLMHALENGSPGAREFFDELCAHHVSGQLKVAPEHVSDKVLKLMRKPPNHVYKSFRDEFERVNKRLGKKQYLIPYLISSHPGSGLKEAVELACYLKKEGFIPDQVQDFYPTPSTLSTCIYHTGINPLTGEDVYVPRDPEEKAMQRALLHFHKPENRNTVIKALKKAGREDLIGRGPSCLVR